MSKNRMSGFIAWLLSRVATIAPRTADPNAAIPAGRMDCQRMGIRRA